VQSTAIAMIGSAVPPSAVRYSSGDACVGPSSRLGMALRRMLLGGLTDLPVVLRKRLVVRRRLGDRARRRDEEDDLVLGGVLTSGLRFGTHTVCAVAAQAKRQGIDLRNTVGAEVLYESRSVGYCRVL
jgi:hypothetical protein